MSVRRYTSIPYPSNLLPIVQMNREYRVWSVSRREHPNHFSRWSHTTPAPINTSIICYPVAIPLQCTSPHARQHSIIWEALRRQRVRSFLSEHLGTRFFQLSQLPHLKAIVSDSVGERPLDSVKSVKISSLDAARALHRVLAAASPVLPIKRHGAFFLPWQRMPAEVNAYCA